MKKLLLMAQALMIIAFFFVMSCGGGSGNNDGDDDSCDANDVSGSYPVKITWDQETCDEDLVDQFVTGTMEIEQDKNVADVYFKEFGSDTEREKLFKGTVCEYTISKTEDKDIPMGEGVDCTQHRQTTYTLTLDSNTQNISGDFAGNYIWQGGECEDYGITPNEQCSWKKVVEPY